MKETDVVLYVYGEDWLRIKMKYQYQAGPFTLRKNMLEGCTSFGICEIKSSVTL